MDGGGGGKSRWPALTILLSALLFSTGPLLVHLTAKDINPFNFNALVLVARAAILLLFLKWVKRRYLDEFFSMRPQSTGESAKTTASHTENESINQGRTPKLSSLKLHLSYFDRIRTKDTTSNETKDTGSNPTKVTVTISSAKLREPRHLLKVPLLWIIVSQFQFGFLAWATQYVETAIASTIYELWPAFVVFGLARHNIIDQEYRETNNQARSTDLNPPQSSNSELVPRGVTREHKALTMLAVIGLVFLLLSQREIGATSLSSLLNVREVVGMVLALVSAFMAFLTVQGTFAYGKVLLYRLVDETEASQEHDRKPIEERGQAEQKLLLWLTLLGLLIGNAVSAIGALPMAFIAGEGIGRISVIGVLGALALGVAFTVGALLLRWGNISAKKPGINALFFLSTPTALLWLLIAGITLPRLDLFVVGAFLIFAINILIQLKPEQQRDVSRFGKEPQTNIRLGFIVFILSLWFSGTFVYIRDEVMPSDWISWQHEEYWGLIALSATIFALILGFRVARLSARITHEDEMLFELFRECEPLARRGGLEPDTLKSLSELDTAQPEKLLESYNSVRARIQRASEKASTSDSASLISIASKLDKLAHSKQQGRDIVELLSLTAFAGVTIGLGLLARPIELADPSNSWSGFLSEVFIFLFVSTVAFLCANLFDIRREREAPLLVPFKEERNDYRVFFRYKRDLSVQHVTAVLISVAMSATFCVLLWGKWL